MESYLAILMTVRLAPETLHERNFPHRFEETAVDRPDTGKFQAGLVAASLYIECPRNATSRVKRRRSTGYPQTGLTADLVRLIDSQRERRASPVVPNP
jgi:hypothetical protein